MDTFISKSVKFIKFYAQKCVHFLDSLVRPVSQDDERQRHEYILNILILGSFTLALVADIDMLLEHARLGSEYQGASPHILTGIVALFGVLYLLSRKGYAKTVSYIFVALYFVPTAYILYVWGADLPQGALTLSLIIVVAGILIGSRFALLVTALSALVLILLTQFYLSGIISPKVYWKELPLTVGDSVVASVTLFITMIVSWLYNRELERSLKRARESEKALAQERDLLEIKVEERTRELKEAQKERAFELYRFAEFGKLTSGFIHDLVNPLTALSLNLEQNYLDKAENNLKKAFQVIEGARHQIQKQEMETNFSVAEEIALSINMLSFKAKKAEVVIEYLRPEGDVCTFGDFLKFYRLVTGLLSNAIEAYDHIKRSDNRKVIVELYQLGQAIKIAFRDFGSGIASENIDKIFDPLFTTKSFDKGIGMGLYVAKDIAEKAFGGHIAVETKLGAGSSFVVEFNKKLEKNEKSSN